MDQQVYSCCHNFLAVTQSYNSKNTPIGRFQAVKIAKSVFLYVFTMEFSTSLLGEDLNNNNKKANHQLFVDKGGLGPQKSCNTTNHYTTTTTTKITTTTIIARSPSFCYLGF